jgi:hypothetical protein
MQKCPIYLYTSSFTVLLDLDQNTRTYNIMYQRDLKIQKGLQNKIQFQFKNSDQKLLRISDTDAYVFTMFHAIDRRQLIEKPIAILDNGTTSTKGLGLLTLSESDTLDLDKGHYKFSIKKLNTDGTYDQTYANTYYGVGGTVELLEDVYPVLQPSQIVTSWQKQYNYDQEAQQYEYYSGNLPAHPEYQGNTALHTVAIYCTKYRGQILVEATQQNTPGSFGDYVTVSSTTVNNFSGVTYLNFNGVWSYVRIRHIPTKNPTTQNNDDSEIDYRGTVDKVLYRS